MKMSGNRKLLTGGIALSLMLAGGLTYGLNGSQVFAADSSTSAKAQKAADHTKSHADDHGKLESYGKSVYGSLYRESASVLGMKEADLLKELKAGKSLADIAAAKKISESDLIAKLTAKGTEKLDAAVKAGKLTADQAANAKQKLADKVKQAVEHKGLMKMDAKRGWKHQQAMRPQMDKIAAFLGMTKEDLVKELKSGKSLTEVAQAHNVTKDQLIAKMKEDLTPMLERMADHKAGDRSDSKGQNAKKAD